MIVKVSTTVQVISDTGVEILRTTGKARAPIQVATSKTNVPKVLKVAQDNVLTALTGFFAGLSRT